MIASHPFPGGAFLFLLGGEVPDSLVFLLGWLLLGWILVRATHRPARTGGERARIHVPPWVREHSGAIGVALGVLLLVYLLRRRRSR